MTEEELQIEKWRQEAKVAKWKAEAAKNKAAETQRRKVSLTGAEGVSPTGAGTYAAFANRPQYQTTRPYSNPDYTPSTGTRIRNVANTAALGWGDEAEAFARSLFSDRSYEDIQRELDWEQQQYMTNRPAEAGLGMLVGGLTGGGLGGTLVNKITQAPRVVQAGQAANAAFPRAAPYAYQTGRHVVAPAATGAVMGAGVAQPGQRGEGALLGAGLNTAASLGMTGLARAGGKALDAATRNRYPETDLGPTLGDTIPISGLVARHPEAKMPEMAASITDRMLGSTAPTRIRRIRQEAPERLIPAPPLEDAQAFDAVVSALRNRSSGEAKELLRQQAQQSRTQRLAPLEAQSQQLTETAAARQQRIKLRKELADRRAAEQRDQTIHRVNAANQQRLIENAAPPNTDPAVIARIKALPATEANDELLKLWKPGRKDPNTSPWAFLGNQRHVVNTDKLLDDAVKATGLIGEREKADVRRRLQAVLKEANPVGDTELATLTSAQLMEARNALRRKANSLTPGTPEANVAIESYRRAAKRVEDEIRAGFGGDPALNKLFDETLDRYARHRLYDDAVRKNLQKGQGVITPENVISVEARKTGQDATTGRSREVRNQFEVQNQIQSAKDAADAALARNKASAEARTAAVTRNTARRQAQASTALEQAKEAETKKEARTMRVLNKATKALDVVNPPKANVFAQKAAYGLALGALPGGLTGWASDESPYTGISGGLLGAWALGRGLSSPLIGRSVAGQTAPQKYAQKFLQTYPGSRGQKGVSATADALRRAAVMNTVRPPLLPVEE